MGMRVFVARVAAVAASAALPGVANGAPRVVSTASPRRMMASTPFQAESR